MAFPGTPITAARRDADWIISAPSSPSSMSSAVATGSQGDGLATMGSGLATFDLLFATATTTTTSERAGLWGSAVEVGVNHSAGLHNLSGQQHQHHLGLLAADNNSGGVVVRGSVAGGGVVGADAFLWHALPMLAVIAWTIGGNILVILAVGLERKLQNVTNYFLMSLAIADLLVGVLVMPIALLTILFNSRWCLPEQLCPIWLYLDVLLSTASILHLCAISIDRYIAIKRPIQHSRFNSKSKMLIKILAVWAVSIGISMPIPVIGLRDSSTVLVASACSLGIDAFRSFIIYGSLCAFFVPLVIMMVTFLLTTRVLRHKAMLCDAGVSRASISGAGGCGGGGGGGGGGGRSLPWGCRGGGGGGSARFRRWHTTRARPCDKPGGIGGGIGGSPWRGMERRSASAQTRVASAAGRASSAAAQHRGAPALSRQRARMRRNAVGKQSMASITNEQRATKVLGIVFVLFVVMWCPFFITNVLSVLCRRGCSAQLTETLLGVFVWVGYVSSGVNPLVYTLFNRAFRQAFRRYIACDYRRPRAECSARGVLLLHCCEGGSGGANASSGRSSGGGGGGGSSHRFPANQLLGCSHLSLTNGVKVRCGGGGGGGGESPLRPIGGVRSLRERRDLSPLKCALSHMSEV
ncbi:5-hydroxytryptamine receptor 2B-like [Petromyzon marinus]|uniref:5-hydroxytryptamine receptor 2B-like n=1 Tax=Petromyzon marinus TaxID=7757 RepID=UPI003F6FBDC1